MCINSGIHGNRHRIRSSNEASAQKRRYKWSKRERSKQKTLSYAQTLDDVLEEGQREHKSYFVVMAELRHKRIHANLLAF